MMNVAVGVQVGFRQRVRGWWWAGTCYRMSRLATTLLRPHARTPSLLIVLCSCVSAAMIVCLQPSRSC